MKILKRLLCLVVSIAMIVLSMPSFAYEDPSDNNKFNLYYAFNSNAQFESFMSRGVSERIESITFGWASLQADDNGLLHLEYEDGDFRVPSGYESVLEKARENNIKVYLNIFCNGPYDNMLGRIETLADEIQMLVNGSTMDGLSFDGVVIDLESLQKSNQRNFSACVWFVNRALKRDGKDVKVAVQPGRGTEYNILNKYSDGYILMFHDYEPKYYSLPVNASKPVITPLAPMDKVLEDLAEELELIGDDKLGDVMLQLNLATAQWKVKSGRIMGPGGEMYPYRPTYETLVQRMTILENEDTTGFKRFEDDSPYLYYYDRIDETWNTIWYEDEISFIKKMNAANDMGVYHFSIWRMGNLPEIARYNLDIPDALGLLE